MSRAAVAPGGDLEVADADRAAGAHRHGPDVRGLPGLDAVDDDPEFLAGRHRELRRVVVVEQHSLFDPADGVARQVGHPDLPVDVTRASGAAVGVGHHDERVVAAQVGVVVAGERRGHRDQDQPVLLRSLEQQCRLRRVGGRRVVPGVGGGIDDDHLLLAREVVVVDHDPVLAVTQVADGDRIDRMPRGALVVGVHGQDVVVVAFPGRPELAQRLRDADPVLVLVAGRETLGDEHAGDQLVQRRRRRHAVDGLPGHRQRELVEAFGGVETCQGGHAVAVAAGHHVVVHVLHELGDRGRGTDAEHDAGAHLVAEHRTHTVDGEAPPVQRTVVSPVLEGEPVAPDVEPAVCDDLSGGRVDDGCGVGGPGLGDGEGRGRGQRQACGRKTNRRPRMQLSDAHCRTLTDLCGKSFRASRI